ncbi:MAG TPA: hypothetical protein VMG98_01385 [Verrucomicrobiae bacterium]|nr:hypothetical protein [Verrucomicrobiae bacterium]
MRSQLPAVAISVLLSACGGGGGANSASALPAVNAGGGSPSASSSPRASTSPRASATPNATPTPVFTPAAGTAPAHIATWAFDESSAEGAGAPVALVQQYLTYAQGGYGDAKARSDCDGAGPSSCSSVFYFDPNFIYDAPSCTPQIASLFMAAADETWFVHETGYSDAAHRVTGSYQESCNGTTITVPVYLTNQSNASVDAFFSNYIQTYASGWDRYFMDDTSASVLTQTYGPGGGFCADNPPDDYCTTTQEYPTDASVVAAHAALTSVLNQTSGSAMLGMFNGVGFSGNTPENLNLIPASNGRLLGAVCENCVVNAGTLESANYQRVLNAMATTNATAGASFVELNTGSSPAGSAAQISQRLVTTAIAWLGFNGNATVVFANLEENSSDLAIWPEAGLYPTQPVQSMNSGASDISVTSNVWRREFGACYLNGSAIGPCAALLNATSSPVPITSSWLTQSYGHVVSIAGGDIESGGSVSLTAATFSSATTTIPASGAVLLVR